MSLTTVANPQTESELVLILSVLEAAEVPAFVHSGGLGGLFPGLEVGSLTSRRVMVPSGLAAEAVAALQEAFAGPEVAADPGQEPVAARSVSVLRAIAEWLLLGWPVSRARGRVAAAITKAPESPPQDQR